jgi:hypothetical protein
MFAVKEEGFVHAAGLRVRFLAPFAAVAAILVLAAPASAATKPYSLVISPAAVPAGVTAPAAVSMTATFKNENKQGSGINLGSANLTPPAGFTELTRPASQSSPAIPSVSGLGTFVCPSSCTATVDTVHNVVQLRGLAVPPGAEIEVSMLVTTPSQAVTPPYNCTVASTPLGTPCTWNVLAKQSNDFNGSPGNNLTVDALPNTVLGQLQFTAQPHNELLVDPLNPTCGNVTGCSDPITDTDYTPSGGPVTLEVVDATGAVVTAYTGAVAVTLNPPGVPPNNGATLNGATTSDVSMGVVKFGNLVVSEPGNQYTLAATTEDTPPLTTTSGPFDAQEAGTRCNVPGEMCRTERKSADVAKPQGIDATVTGTFPSGQPTDLAETLDFGGAAGHLPAGTLSPPTQCEGYNAPHDVYWDFPASNSGSTTLSITTTVASGTVNGSTIKGQDNCLGAPKPFFEIDESTNPPSLRLLGPADQTTLPDGTVLFIGLLPDCGTKSNQVPQGTGPCVLSRSGSSASSTLTITISVPASLGDPVSRG